MGNLIMFLMLLFYAATVVVVAGAVVAAPIYLALHAARQTRAVMRRRQEARRPATRDLARAQAELKEQYAAGMLTLVGLEARTDAVQRASSHLELAGVLDDLPRRVPPAPLSARFEAVAGIAVLLLLHSLWSDALGALLVVGAVVPAARWRVVAGAFAAGVAVVAAPLAAVPLAVSASLRWREGRDG